MCVKVFSKNCLADCIMEPQSLCSGVSLVIKSYFIATVLQSVFVTLLLHPGSSP